MHLVPPAGDHPLVVQWGRVYCSWDCAGSLEPIVPGRYLG